MTSVPASPYDTKPMFFVYAPDKQPHNLAHRMSVRPRHLVNMRKRMDEGMIRFGAILIDEESITAETKNFQGSTLFVRADNLAQVREMIEGDPYWIEGVWDPERIIYSPVIPAGPASL